MQRAGAPDAHGQPALRSVASGGASPCRHCLELIADGDTDSLVAQHLQTVHHAPGNASQRRRRAMADRYAGDDVTYAVRKKSPPLPAPLTLRAGDPLDSDLFPVVLS